MSATLLCCALVLRIVASAPTGNNYDKGLITLDETSRPLSENGVTVMNPNKRILIEEVDKNGNSVLKELELPDYDESEELEEDRRRREEQEKEYQNEEGSRREEMYGCEGGSGNRLRKCLLRQKKLLRERYRNWKVYIRKIMKDLDGKIKTLGRRGSKAELNFMSGFSPKNVMRKKE